MRMPDAHSALQGHATRWVCLGCTVKDKDVIGGALFDHICLIQSVRFIANIYTVCPFFLFWAGPYQLQYEKWEWSVVQSPVRVHHVWYQRYGYCICRWPQHGSCTIWERSIWLGLASAARACICSCLSAFGNCEHRHCIDRIFCVWRLKLVWWVDQTSEYYGWHRNAHSLSISSYGRFYRSWKSGILWI